MTIVFFEATDEDKKVLTELLAPQDYTLDFVDDKLSLEGVDSYKDADIISVFVGSTVTKEIIDALPNLKYIATRSTGFDHIDYAYAKTKGIPVSNVPAYGMKTVAEFAFGLILALSRKIVDASSRIRGNTDFDFRGLQGFDLEGKTLGVIGTGKIGKNVAKIAKGFAMQIIAFDAFPDEAFAKEQGLRYLSLDDVLAQADVVTLHAPYNEKTHHLINKDNISKMKQGAYLINTARGELVETDALAGALVSGHLGGAGLDVLEGERQLHEEAHFMTSSAAGELAAYKTLLEDHVLIDLPNVIITPHIAFNSREAVHGILKTTTENIAGFLGGKSVNIVGS